MSLFLHSQHVHKSVARIKGLICLFGRDKQAPYHVISFVPKWTFFSALSGAPSRDLRPLKIRVTLNPEIGLSDGQDKCFLTLSIH